MDLDAKLSELSRVTSREAPVLSVYVDTRWRDEHHRARARVEVLAELRRARERVAAGSAADVDWAAEQVSALLEAGAAGEGPGMALFACAPLGVREVLRVRAPVESRVVLGERPHLRPLVEAAEATPPTLVVYVDGERARLIPAGVGLDGEEVTLESEVQGHHRRGGWALLAQSRYQRHLDAQRARHIEAVAETLARVADSGGARAIVLAGDTRNVARLQRALPAPVAERVVGTVRGAAHEAAAALVERATALLTERQRETVARAVDTVLTEAAKHGRAVAGLRDTLRAVSRDAVHALFLLETFHLPGVACLPCRVLRAGTASTCGACGRDATTVELGEAMIERVLEAGGRVETVSAHAALADHDGLAASLRYPI